LLVRLQPPQLFPRREARIRKGKPIGDGSRLENGRAIFPKSLEGSTPSPSASCDDVPLAERQRRQPSKLDSRVRLPEGTLGILGDGAIGDRLTVGRLALNQVVEVQVLLPEFEIWFGRPEIRPCSGAVAAGTRYLALNQEAVGSIPTPGSWN
jgi:hypothetical protein